MSTTTNTQYKIDCYGFQKQVDTATTVVYDMAYKQKQSTTPEMSWLRLGWLAAHIPIRQLREFSTVDIGAGNGVFLREARKVFKSVVPYDLAGESITEQELLNTYFDLIILTDVLEHYKDVDDLWKLNFKYALISFPETPDYNVQAWKHYKPGEHLYNLNAVSFNWWARHHDCQVLAQGTPEDLIRTRWDASKPNISTFLIRRAG